MMRATDFEFRYRWSFFAVLYGGPFFLTALDVRPISVLLGRFLAHGLHWPVTVALHVTFGLGALFAVVGGIIRTWGSSHLTMNIVHNPAVRTEVLHAAGPYRFTRNPLYLGSVLLGFAMAMFANRYAAGLIVAGVLIFVYRLIGREEAELAAVQGESYRQFCRAVPRLFPALRARIPESAAKPNWRNGIATEIYFWCFALGMLLAAVTLRYPWFYLGIAAGFGASAITKFVRQRLEKSVSTHSGA